MVFTGQDISLDIVGGITNPHFLTHQIHDHLFKCGLFEKALLQKLVKDTAEVFRQEQNCLDLWGPFTVVGDIHGQYHVKVTHPFLN